jgi:hypothetical protein
MSITVEYYKGRSESEVRKEYEAIHGHGTSWNDKEYKDFEHEALKNNSYGKIVLHQNNWRQIFKEYKWVIVRLEELLNHARIKEFSDYPIQYRCGRACMPLETDELIKFYEDTLEEIEKGEALFDDEEIIWDSRSELNIKHRLGLELWEATAIFKMMNDLQKIKEE